jgi:hypothetical protein
MEKIEVVDQWSPSYKYREDTGEIVNSLTESVRE